MNKENVITPCITVCRTDPITDFCYGCGRSSEDKKMWSNPNTSDEWKKSNLELIRGRLSGWQQNAWNKSYSHKIKTGNSLLKEKIINQKK